MYKIYVDGVLFYDSTLEEMQIESGTITRELSKAGSFKFSIYPDHPFYDSIKELKSVIEVYKDNVVEPLFRGRALYHEFDFFNKKTYTCEGHYNYLLDSVTPNINEYYTPEEFFTALIENHNSQVDEYKRFEVGKIEITGESFVVKESSTKTQELLQKYLVKEYGGHIVPRLHDEIWYIDYIKEFTERGSQYIEFGENLSKFVRKDDFSNVASGLLAYDYYDRTVAEENNGEDILFDKTAVSLYGKIIETKKFEDVQRTYILIDVAREYLNDRVKKQIVIEVDAIDLSLLDRNIESFKFATYNRIVSKPHYLDDWFLITKQTINLTDPSKDSVVLGGTFETFTDQTAGVGSVVKTIDSTVEKAVTNSPTIKTIEEKIEKIETSVGLPEVTTNDNGKILMVVDGKWNAETLNVYAGEYEVTPTVDGMTLETAQTLMSDDLKVNAIPFFEVENTSGGNTVYIADEIEVE